MRIFFIDDSRQNSPKRKGVGPLVALGGISVHFEDIPPLEAAIAEICQEFGFPEGEIFKWSPSKKHWMYENLTGKNREHFFKAVIKKAVGHDSEAFFVAEDLNCKPAVNCHQPHEHDAIDLLIERISNNLSSKNAHGLIVSDRSGSSHKEEEKFLAICLEKLKVGTTYVTPKKIIIPFLSSPMSTSRILQLADLITSCTLARICSDYDLSKVILNEILPLFPEDHGRKGGVSVKIHPDLKYRNLYHWLFGDEYYVRYPKRFSLPMADYPYFKCEHDG